MTKQLLIGLPETGKTTFLAALWNVVEYGNSDTMLKLNELTGDRDYLNSIREDWLKCEVVPRTQSGQRHDTIMQLKDNSNGTVTEILIPDLSGEIFDKQWEDRRLSLDYKELLDDISGILVFIHPDQLKKPVSIISADELVGSENSSKSFTTTKEWTPTMAPTQVVLVELLQFIFMLRKIENLKIGIIISAWDLVENANQLAGISETPNEYLAKYLPLFYQYLKGNCELIQYSVFGISAQGGDFKKDIDKLRGMTNPSDRIKVLVENDYSHDITLPIKWIMS